MGSPILVEDNGTSYYISLFTALTIRKSRQRLNDLSWLKNRMVAYAKYLKESLTEDIV